MAIWEARDQKSKIPLSCAARGIVTWETSKVCLRRWLVHPATGDLVTPRSRPPGFRSLHGSETRVVRPTNASLSLEPARGRLGACMHREICHDGVFFPHCENRVVPRRVGGGVKWAHAAWAAQT